ncbi:thiol-disulfide isomerase-like thioredoxin [Aequorivita sublithincola DSM 14238]|uniref:Thiol-disulfide isomerase-like thioredoxin n=1 Tax=Aequorivita sublithincola (strain DSM 14238 / LMG 21431 / ACAM 643 / 9-3) TaxID=746697 RepID=I3YXP6_AEQSU|nr:TlpA disulfide reductase family protein [Aequorivita sublithincola]AFL81764.1 thiol-disulfide isomerase-like thioredoxin [Aequorivita sublithincola DSM 14238]
MKYLTIFLIIFTLISCQEKEKKKEKTEPKLNENYLVLGEKVEDIKITDFISNIPKYKELKDKFLVIDFWATWCAPCLKSVPHFNQLQNEFKDNSNIAFVSLTDETPKIAKRIMNKINFETIVASDQSKETQKNYKISSLPTTVIIDKNNLVRWIGIPEELDKETINKIISDPNWQPENKPKPLKTDEKLSEKYIKTSISKTLTEFSELKSNIYSFNLTFADKSDPKSSSFSLPSGKYIDLNTGLKNILSKVTRKPVSEIIIPTDLEEKNFNLLYLNTNLKKEHFDMEIFMEQLTIIKEKILTALDLQEKIETQNAVVYILKVRDKSKLENGSGEVMSHTGDNDKYLTFSNVDINLLMKNIAQFYNIILVDETNLDGKYEFLIDKNDFEQAQKDLLSYGISVEKTKKDIEFNIYEKL